MVSTALLVLLSTSLFHSSLQCTKKSGSGRDVGYDDSCEKLPCNFNNGKTCGYTLKDSSLNVGNNFKEWYHSSQLVTNSALQIANLGDGEGKLPPSGGFAIAQGLVFSRGQKYAFASPEFSSSGRGKLRFKYHARVPGSILYVCHYGGSCFFQIRIVKGLVNTWQQAELPLPPTRGSSKIMFVARDLGEGAWVGVDNIEVIIDGKTCSDRS